MPSYTFQTFLGFTCAIPHSNKNLPWEKQKAFQSLLAFQVCTAKAMPLPDWCVRKNHAPNFPLSLRQWSKSKTNWGVRSLNIFMYLNPARWVHRWIEKGSTLEQPRKYNSAWCSVLPCCTLKYKTWQIQLQIRCGNIREIKWTNRQKRCEENPFSLSALSLCMLP